MAMLAAAAIAAGMWPKRNKRAVNKQRYGCMSTEDFAFFCPRERAVSSSPAGDRVPSVETARRHNRPGTAFSNSSAELIFGLD